MSEALAVHEFDPAAMLGGNSTAASSLLEIAPERWSTSAAFLRSSGSSMRLSTVTAVDRYPAEPRFEVVYHLHSIARNQRLRVKCRLAGENPEIDSVTGVWRAANWYEREVFDLFGVRFRNHPGPAPHHAA